MTLALVVKGASPKNTSHQQKYGHVVRIINSSTIAIPHLYEVTLATQQY